MKTYNFPVSHVLQVAHNCTGLWHPTRGRMEEVLRNSPECIELIHNEALKAQGRNPEEVVDPNDPAHYAIEELMISFTLSKWDDILKEV